MMEYACENRVCIGKFKDSSTGEGSSKEETLAQIISGYGFPIEHCELALKKNTTGNDAVLWLLKYADDLARGGWDGNTDSDKKSKGVDKSKGSMEEEKLSEAYSCKSNENQDKDYQEYYKLYQNHLGSSFVGSDSEKLETESLEIEATLSICYTRRALLSLLENVPASQKLSLELIGGSEKLVDLLKLCAFESLMTGAVFKSSDKILQTAAVAQSKSVLDRLASILTKIFSREGKAATEALISKILIEPLNALVLESNKTDNVSNAEKKIENEAGVLSNPYSLLSLWLVEFMSGLGLAKAFISSSSNSNEADPSQSKLLECVHSVLVPQVFESLLGFASISRGSEKLLALSLSNKLIERLRYIYIYDYIAKIIF